MIKGWNYAGGKVRVNEPSFPSPAKGLIIKRTIVPYYSLPTTQSFRLEVSVLDLASTFRPA